MTKNQSCHSRHNDVVGKPTAESILATGVKRPLGCLSEIKEGGVGKQMVMEME